jgi:hypothetical protein
VKKFNLKPRTSANSTSTSPDPVCPTYLLSWSVVMNGYQDVISLQSQPTRPLTPTEIQQLQSNNNHILPPSTWTTNVHVLQSSSTTFSTGNIRNVTFGGHNTLGSFTNQHTVRIEGIALPSGLYDSTIFDSTISDGARISQTVLLSRCVVSPGAAIVGCGKVCMRAVESSFANGHSIPVAVETGGREVMVWAGMTLEEASRIAGNRSDAQLIRQWEQNTQRLADQIKCKCSLFGRNSVVFNCPRIEDVFIGAGAFVEGSSVVNASVLSSNDAAKHPHATTSIVGGCFIENSIVQWGCTCESMSIVSDSFMCSTSHVERHAKLLESILGPCSGVAEGEISASLVGPFVGFHHQSLLIACYWPAGRGNIGYGANVGSNHTGKAPDQEIWPGEGLFFGLATAIKFPSNFIKAPYTLIATGVTTLPQRLEMPFSLINASSEIIPNVSPAFNEVVPGWILSDNLYMILRNETKFQKRGKKATQLSADTGHVNYDHQALRPCTVTMMLEARHKLMNVKTACKYMNSKQEGIWTSKEIDGIGKNYMKESTRLKSIQVYSDFVLFYGVRAMWRALNNADGDPHEKVNQVLHGTTQALSFSKGRRESKEDSTSTAKGNFGMLKVTSTATVSERGANALDEWFRYAQQITKQEMLQHNLEWTVKNGLLKYIELQTLFAQNVLLSKQKDDKRGPKIIDGYKDAHGAAEKNDQVVQKAKEDAIVEKRNVMAFLNRYAETKKPSKL